MNKPLSMKDFRTLSMRRNDTPATVIRLLAPTVAPEVKADSRVVRFIFSDSSVDRYGDTIDARGWAIEHFMTNPVALFGHDSGTIENVVGKAVRVWVEGDKLVGDIEFAEASVNPAAETVFQMVKAGYLNAVSVGFAPLEWTLTKDKSRPGGIDFKKQELLEISIVPIPANANALAVARSAGIAVDLLRFEEPIEEKSTVKIKSLWHVSFLAGILADLGMLEDAVDWEAANEGDGSAVPAALVAAMQTLGQVLLDMTAEEVAELLSETGASTTDEVVSAAFEQATSKIPAVKEFFSAFTKERTPAPVVDRAGKVLSSDNETMLREAHEAIAKGCENIMAVLSAASTSEASAEPETRDSPEPVVDTTLDLRRRKARAAQITASVA